MRQIGRVLTPWSLMVFRKASRSVLLWLSGRWQLATDWDVILNHLGFKSRRYRES